MKKFENTKYPSIVSSNILTEEEMSSVSGGACSFQCKPGCSEDCKPGKKVLGCTPEKPIE